MSERMPSPGSSALASLLVGFTQGNRIVRLTTPLGADVLLAECVLGEEGISQGFRFNIAALSTDAAIPLKSLIGQPVLLELMTASRDQLRPFHGHITAIDMAGANGGFTRYNLTLEPWTAFLARGRDSRIFQDMAVFDILDAVFTAYQGQGKLAPAWRFDILDRAVYPKRSITTQYQESDLAFAERLMHEEGLFHYFKHQGDAASPGLGSHTLVIADHNGSFKPNQQASIAYTQPGATMQQDSLDRWRTELRLQTNAIELSSWDYRSLDTRLVSATGADGGDGAPLLSRDAPGAYAYQSREQGEHIVDHHVIKQKGWGPDWNRHDMIGGPGKKGAGWQTEFKKLNDNEVPLYLCTPSARVLTNGIDSLWRTNRGRPHEFAVVEAKANMNPAAKLINMLGKPKEEIRDREVSADARKATQAPYRHLKAQNPAWSCR